MVHTEAKLFGDEQAKEHGPAFTKLRQRLEKEREGQLCVWHDEGVASDC